MSAADESLVDEEGAAKESKKVGSAKELVLRVESKQNGRT